MIRLKEMVRTYVKKTDRKVTSPGNLKSAVDLVKNEGWAVRAAARHANVNRSVLWLFLKKNFPEGADEENVNYKLTQASRKVFTDEHEESIATYCIDVATMGYRLTVLKVRQLAYEVAVKNDLKIPPTWTKNEAAGLDWFQGFQKRHKKILIRTPEACSIAKAMAFNKPTVEDFFNRLEEMLARNPNFRNGSRLYNIDEISTKTVQSIKKLVSPKGVKQVHQITTAEQGTSVTTTVIIGANCSILPPIMIFPKKGFQSNMLINAFPGTLVLANETGDNTKESFYEALKHFIQHTKSSKENPTLLLLNNVLSYFSTKVLDLAKENCVTMLTFPSQTTHKLQPLDVGFFKPFRINYDNEIHNFILRNPGVSITIYDIAGFVCDALLETASPLTILHSFSKPGIFPFNRNVFHDSDFALASVTDRPEVLTCDADNTFSNSDDLQGDLPDEAATLDVTPAVTQNDTQDVVFLSPADIRGYPQAKKRPTTRKGRQKGRSIVVTDTPETIQISEKEEELAEEQANA